MLKITINLRECKFVYILNIKKSINNNTSLSYKDLIVKKIYTFNKSYIFALLKILSHIITILKVIHRKICNCFIM